MLTPFVPCTARLAVFRQESGSWRWTAANLLLMLVVSVGLAVVVYQVGSLLAPSGSG